MANKIRESPSDQGLSMRDRSSALTFYVSPAAAKALKIYAVQNDRKVHDCLIEATEAWFKANHLKESVRVT